MNVCVHKATLKGALQCTPSMCRGNDQNVCMYMYVCTRPIDVSQPLCIGALQYIFCIFWEKTIMSVYLCVQSPYMVGISTRMDYEGPLYSGFTTPPSVVKGLNVHIVYFMCVQSP